MSIAEDINAAAANSSHDADIPADGNNAAADAQLPEGIADYIDLFRAGQQGAATLSAARLRADMGASIFEAPSTAPLHSFTTFIVLNTHEIGVKIYHPGTETLRPGVCYFHGGGFAFGSLESFDSVAAGIAEETGAVVASVQYRRLPENRYDDAQEDCYAALVWLCQHAPELNIDSARLCVAGDSVGALMATTAAMQARDRNGPALACQILLYGAFALESGRPAYARSRDPLLTGDRVEGFIDLYHRTREDGSAFVPPLAAADLSGLPPAIILAAERDPLCDEALEYAERLTAAGASTTRRVAPGMIHGFLRARAMSPAAASELKTIAANARPYLWPATAAQTEKASSL